MPVGLLSYIQVAIVSFVINVIPAFVPPTWIVLSLYKINRPDTIVILLALFGVIGSVAGRYVMYRYSNLFGKYVPKKQSENLKYFGKIVGGNEAELFLGTFFYSLSPLPSNFLFIAFGFSGISILPVLTGFALGRFLSYYLLTLASFKSFSYFTGFVGPSYARVSLDIIGLVFAVLVIFIKWKKIYFKLNEIRNSVVLKFKRL